MPANPLAQVYLERLAQFEGRKFCSVKEASTYLDLSRDTIDALLDSRAIKSQYFGHSRRKVLVASLLEYVDKHMPIDRPAPKNPT